MTFSIYCFQYTPCKCRHIIIELIMRALYFALMIKSRGDYHIISITPIVFWIQGVHEKIYLEKFNFATSPSPSLGCHWLYKIWPADRSDCTPRSLVDMIGSLSWRVRVAVNWEKTIFLNTPYLPFLWNLKDSVIDLFLMIIEHFQRI